MSALLKGRSSGCVTACMHMFNARACELQPSESFVGLPAHCCCSCDVPRKAAHRRLCRCLRTKHADAPVHICSLLRWVLKKFAEIASSSRGLANVFFDKRNTPNRHWKKGQIKIRPTRRASRPFNEARSSAADNDRNLRIF